MNFKKDFYQQMLPQILFCRKSFLFICDYFVCVMKLFLFQQIFYYNFRNLQVLKAILINKNWIIMKK